MSHSSSVWTLQKWNKAKNISLIPRCCELYRDWAPHNGGDGRGGEAREVRGRERDGPRDPGHAAGLRLSAHVHAHPQLRHGGGRPLQLAVQIQLRREQDTTSVNITLRNGVFEDILFRNHHRGHVCESGRVLWKQPILFMQTSQVKDAGIS